MAGAALPVTPVFSCRFINSLCANFCQASFPIHPDSLSRAVMSLGWGVAAVRGVIFFPLAQRGASILLTIYEKFPSKTDPWNKGVLLDQFEKEV